MALATFNCFTIPYNVAYETQQSIVLNVINGIIDLLFLVDIAINFRTTYIDIKSGEEVTKVFNAFHFNQPNKIAKKYLRERFWVDVLATIPFDIFAQVILFYVISHIVASG